MISALSITAITVVGILFCFSFLCTAVVFCCCALSSANLCGALLCFGGSSLFFRRKPRYQVLTGGERSISGANYQCRSHSSSYGHSNGLISSNTDGDVTLAEAYLIAPLVEARVMNENSPQHEITPNIMASGTNDAYNLENGEGPQHEYPAVVFKDVWAAVLFIIQAIVIIWLGVRVSLKSLKVINSNEIQAGGLGSIAAACGLLGCASTIMGAAGITFLLRNSDYIIEGVMWVNIAVCAVGAVLCLASGGALFFSIILGGLAALSYCYLNSVRSRIAFASAVLSVACRAIKDNYMATIVTAYFMLFVQLGWFILWSIASYGVYLTFLSDNNPQGTKKDNSQDIQLTSGQGVIMFLLFVSLHWGSEVIKSLLQTTVNGVIACWWYQPNRKAVVRGALFRSLTTSFGSICLGSLIVAAIQALRDLLNMAKNKRDDRNRRGGGPNDCLIKVADFLLQYVEQAVQYFNKYAYCYVAAYGLGFVESAKKVTQLFTDRGWTAIINDNLVSNALSFAMFGMTAVTALLGAFSSLLFGPSLEQAGISSPITILSIIGGLMGFAVAIVLTNALNSGVAMVFVCMAENPEALKTNRPREFEILTAAWLKFHPNEMTWVAPVAIYNNYGVGGGGGVGSPYGGGSSNYGETGGLSSNGGGPVYGVPFQENPSAPPINQKGIEQGHPYHNNHK